MQLLLIRKQKNKYGIFGDLLDEKWNHLFVTLEHAYPMDDGTFVPKIPPGYYKCVKGKHRLDGMSKDFDTFEVMGVKNHTGILFHWGNYNKDSDGCILLGIELKRDMIVNSRLAFLQFIALMPHDFFYLQVK